MGEWVSKVVEPVGIEAMLDSLKVNVASEAVLDSVKVLDSLKMNTASEAMLNGLKMNVASLIANSLGKSLMPDAGTFSAILRPDTSTVTLGLAQSSQSLVQSMFISPAVLERLAGKIRFYDPDS